MKRKIAAPLHEAWIDGSLVKIRRALFDASSTGFVLDVSSEWLLLHVVDPDFLQSDGYEAVRLRDITRAEKQTNWVARARESLGLETLLQPDVLLLDLPGLLSSVNAHFPVLGIEQEEASPDTLHIGRIENLRKKSVVLRELGSQAEWFYSDARLRLKDITRVTFGTTYMRLLLDFARVQEAEAARESDNPDVL